MKKKLKEAMHRYKVEAFKISHNGAEVDPEVSKEILEHTDEALENAYSYHFKRDPNPQRVETFQMVKRFVLEAILPPVVEKMMRRITVLERQNSQMVTLLDELMEALSEEEEVATNRALQ
ncbi:MAG: hypothetical protein VYE77_06265 [Planctomycetota bacterium]|nr:hypothetical protein [Planctomycetota bacterium]